MENAILLHGTPDKEEYYSDKYPSASNSHWLPWLQKQLLIKGILTHTPEIPDSYKPNYEKWKREFERFDIGKDTILVGHSCGGGFLLRWLTENKVKIVKLILVAPWLDPDRRKTTGFFNFTIDSGITDRTKEVHILVSEDDDKEILESVKTIKEALPNAKLHSFKNMGHFCYEDMKTDRLPELLEIIENEVKK